ncbi:MAG: hypothetical protein ACRDRG_05850 [Pseudonocardiaceae bacterium]
MKGVRITHIGGPTVLIEVPGGCSPIPRSTPGAYRLGGACDLIPWGPPPARGAGPTADRDHGRPVPPRPPLSHPITGDVIGFALRWDDQNRGVLWISGDSVLYHGVRQVAGRVGVDLALLHLGGVRFPITGPLRYTMTAASESSYASSSAHTLSSPSTTRASNTSARAAPPSKPPSPSPRPTYVGSPTGSHRHRNRQPNP